MNNYNFLFYRLKEHCERLMFFNPIEYGRKAEEVLWRRVFYDVIQIVKHSKDVCLKLFNVECKLDHPLNYILC